MAKKELRHFAFTFNNYQEVDYCNVLLQAVDKLEINYIIAAHEIAPTTGTPHLQGYAQLSKKKYKTTIIKWLPGCHITEVNGSSEDNINYCNKVDSDPIEWGIMRSIARGRAKQARDWALLIQQAEAGDLQNIKEHHPMEYLVYYNTLHKIAIASMNPKPVVRKCYWLFGKPGTGKSRFCQQFWPNAYWKNANKWWDGYQGQREVVLDDLGTAHLSEHLKRWADRYKLVSETKGGAMGMPYEVFVITSNFTPQRLFEEVPQETVEAIQRRFEVFEVLRWDEEADRCVVRDPQDREGEMYLDYLLNQDHQEVDSFVWNGRFLG